MVKSVKPILLLKVEEQRGNATENNPLRVVTQFWDFNNNLVFEKDPIES